MLPNYILKHAKFRDLAVYCQIKRFAGESGTCSLSTRSLEKHVGAKRNTIKKSIDFLLKRGWIVETEPLKVTTPGGPQSIRCFKVADIWALNVNHFKGGSKKDTPLSKVGQNRIGLSPKGGSKKDNEEEGLNTIKNAARAKSATPPQSFSFEEYVKRMSDHKARYIQIIAFYFEEKGLKFDTLPQAQAAIRRHLRAAKQLEPFTDAQIVAAAKEAAREYPRAWTIETLLKIVTK